VRGAIVTALNGVVTVRLLRERRIDINATISEFVAGGT
jgi:hypothetical protein